MVDARWVEVRADFESAADHFIKSGQIFDSGEFDSLTLGGYVSKMALMHSMQSGYTSFESGMKRILNILGEELPSGDSWRADLLKRSSREIEGGRPAIISKDVFKMADHVRRFRHVATRTYDDFDVRDSAVAVRAAKQLSKAIMGEVEEFIDMIDPKPINLAIDIFAR